MIITNGKIVTWGDPNEILEDKALLIQHGLIQEIANETELRLLTLRRKYWMRRGKW